ncbi:MAG: Hsp20/alpha crystallin family protein [Chthoniobacteraceae bacterium]
MNLIRYHLSQLPNSPAFDRFAMLRDELTRLVDPAPPARENYVTPLANIIEDKDGFVLVAEMPGVSKDGVEITVENGALTIVGRRTPTESKTATLHRETLAGDFRRAFEIDPSIDATKISARIDNGILTLHLPKAEAVKPRKIVVAD